MLIEDVLYALLGHVGSTLVTRGKDGRFDLAAPSMLRAVEIDPSFASAWQGVATSFVLQRRCEDAMEALDRYVELNPDDAGGYYNRGGCRYQAGDKVSE
mgnify:CR=1 FL=1